jgi:hypothetical protein
MEPKDLKDAGKSLWVDVTEVSPELSPTDQYILYKACKLADHLEELEQGQMERDLIARGSMGQEIVSPLVPEIRQFTAQLTATLFKLKIPDASIDRIRDKQRGTGRFDSTSGKKAAEKKWGEARIISDGKK